MSSVVKSFYFSPVRCAAAERVDEESTPSVECTQGHQKVDLPQVSTWSGAESFFSEMARVAVAAVLVWSVQLVNGSGVLEIIFQRTSER